MSEYVAGDGFDPFERADAAYRLLEQEFAGPDSDGWTHAEMEDWLDARAREVIRQLFQDRSDLRAARERREPVVVGADEVERTRTEPRHARGLATIFGPIRVERMAYRAAGVRNLYPADARWNLPEGLRSHGLARWAAIESARGSFESAQTAIERATGVRMGKRQLEDSVVASAADIDEFYRRCRPTPIGDDQLLVLTCDGKGVVMRPEALRDATAKAAAASSAKLTARVSPGEKTNRKRMAELACVYDAVPAVRAPSDVIRPAATTRADTTRRKGPEATGKWMTGSVVEAMEPVISSAFDEAERRDPDHKRTWIALVDGNKQQIDTITAEAARRGVDVSILIDFIHVAEYVWGAAWSFFTPGDPDAQTRVADRLTAILNGNAREVAAGIRRRATTFKFKDRERAGADKCADYLTNKADHLGYDTALASGWPIATGIIEGACRYIICDRLDITGARWGLAGAEAVLKLRALISNNDFNDYWTFHLQQEQHRIHHTRYQQPHGTTKMVA